APSARVPCSHKTPRRVVPGVGIEPTWPRGRKILSLLRIPGFATRARGRAHGAGTLPVKRMPAAKAASAEARGGHGGWRGARRAARGARMVPGVGVEPTAADPAQGV